MPIWRVDAREVSAWQAFILCAGVSRGNRAACALLFFARCHRAFVSAFSSLRTAHAMRRERTKLTLWLALPRLPKRLDNTSRTTLRFAVGQLL